MRNLYKLLLLFLIISLGYSQDLKNGEKIFKQNCTACHALDRKVVGPPLEGVVVRWNGDVDELVKFIKNSQKYINGKEKHSDYAKKLFEEYNKVQMLAYEHLKDEDIKDVIAYIQAGGKVGGGEQEQAKQEDKGDNELVAKGEKLFKQNCTACHALDRKVVGPALQGVVDRWNGDEEEIIKFIKNSQKYINGNEKHSDYAKKLFEQYNKTQMLAFEHLKDEDIKAILAYIKAGPKKETPTAAAGGATTKKEEKKYTASAIKTYTIIGIVALVILLFAVVGYTEVLRAKREGREAKPGEAIKRFAKNPYFVGTVVFLIFAVGLNEAIQASLKVGLHQGYQPKQPVFFSHRIHAGIDKISCQYCHTGVERGQAATIPSTSVCMNCHKYIQEYTGEPFGGKSKDELTAEIKKVIKAYETGEPIQWVRIHNLPDFVYYSHAQHVKVGLDGAKDPNTLRETCAKCHGKVWEMDEVYQYSELSMGWCVDCHRETKVDLTKSDYYKTTHKGLLEKHKVVTVEELGGLNCARCHY